MATISQGIDAIGNANIARVGIVMRPQGSAPVDVGLDGPETNAPVSGPHLVSVIFKCNSSYGVICKSDLHSSD